MRTGRPILAAVGLFFGGLVVGSLPGAQREGTARAAGSDPGANANATPPREAKRERGPIAPALRKTGILRGLDASDIEPPAWSTKAAASCVAPKGRGGSERGRTTGRGDSDDPLSGLAMPQLPIPRNEHVLKYVRYFSEHHEGRKTVTEALRRSGRYQEIIAKAFRELGLPQELMAVAFIESGFSVEALSTAGAMGLWQFMPATGRAYGLTIESTVDERAAIWRSTEAAAHHLSDLYERCRSWELALAAYNLGYENLERRLDEYETDDFWTLAESPGALPKETAHYVPKVLASAVILANLDAFGFADVERAAPIDASELEVAGGTKLATVARAAGTSLRLLRELNPEFLADIVPDRGASTILHVPRAGLARARTMLPKLATEGDERTPRVSDDFDWGTDDLRSGRSRLERTSTRSGPRRTRRRATAEETRAKLASSESDEARSEKTEKSERSERSERVEKSDSTRVLYRVVAGDSVPQIAAMVGLTVDQLLAQAHVTAADQIKVGTLLDLHVPNANPRANQPPAPREPFVATGH